MICFIVLECSVAKCPCPMPMCTVTYTLVELVMSSMEHTNMLPISLSHTEFITGLVGKFWNEEIDLTNLLFD